LVAYIQFLLEKVPAAVLTLIFGWLAIKLLTFIVGKALKAAKAEPTVASAASGTTGDIIAGIFLASDEDFKVGYTVNDTGVTGIIKSIDLRKSRSWPRTASSTWCPIKP